MQAEYHPLQGLLMTVSGWVNRHQQHVIEYLVEENRVLQEQRGGKVPRLNDDQRRRLAAKAKLLGRRALDAVATIVTPDTLIRWHTRLIAAKWTFVVNRVGRPGLMKAIKALIVRFAFENPSWGYCRIQGELKDVGHQVASTTIANVLKENGIKPAPDGPAWSVHGRNHAEWGSTSPCTDSDWVATQ
ncbi:MAG: putative transposase [Planctomycetota bacterium]|jgi:putative transposase